MKSILKICLTAAIILAVTNLANAAVLEVRAPSGGVSALGDVYTTIQAAINDAGPGDTIIIHNGTYDEALNIDAKTNLTLQGESKENTILKSSSTLSWAIPGYPQYDGRMTVIRIYNSSVTTIENMTIDCDLIKGNSRYGISGWDSSVTVNNCILKNMSAPDLSGYYTELMSYFRAVGFTDESRAAINITNNTFIDAGRVGVVTHDYILATISGNTFYKTIDDFGYAVELGSMSKGSITGNIIYGYDTPAASDGSSSAGLYIENCFTNGITDPIAKDVLLQGNEIYDCQYAMTVGNEWDGYAGNVDIALTLQGNNIHNNISGGLIIADEDKEAGSSVAVSGSGNTIADNNEFGYFIYTVGDGDITINLSGDTISGHDYGMYVGDYASGTSGSSYSMAVNNSKISQNSVYGIDNEVASFNVNAESNWWGDATGPYHSTNPAGQGNAVSDNVDFIPWYTNEAMLSPVIVKIGDTEEIRAYSDTIQGGVVAALDGDTVVVSAGIYIEQVEITKALTIKGAGQGSTIIQSPDTLPLYYTTSAKNYAIVYLHGVCGVVIKDLTVDGAGKGNANYRFQGIGLFNAGATVENVSIINVEDTPFSGAQHGVGLYAYNTTGSVCNVDVLNCSVSSFQKTAIAISGAMAVGRVENCVITGAGDTTITAQNGIQIGYGTSGTVKGNTVSGIRYDGPSWSASGILGYGSGGSETIDIEDNKISSSQGAIQVYYFNGGTTVINNKVSDSNFSFLYAFDKGTVTGNDFSGSSEQGLYLADVTNIKGAGNSFSGCDIGLVVDGVSDGVAFSNCQFRSNSEAGVVVTSYEGISPTNVSINNSNFGSNGSIGLQNDSNNVVDAGYNWWGSATGPSDPCGTNETDGKNCYDVATVINADGLGDLVSDGNVLYCPWLAAPMITSSDGQCPLGDLDGDCDVDFADLAILAQNWLVGVEEE